ncbi:GIY-YIG nuclease family protein [Chitinophaga sp. RCC_12]|uniref:GIY-YIG nuclease family protein n=1 Tax=Chitinophaga sp. RCC_12 TaxID=3239226 RepID=UPI003523BDE7
MKSRGVSIKIFLNTGNRKGIVTASIANWTGIAIRIPRHLFEKLKKQKELHRPGVYFLLGQDIDNPTTQCIYIGEANNLMERIIQHLRKSDKTFTTDIICFYSQDDNLTISHTKYLELKMIEMLSKLTDLRLTNISRGTRVSISQATKAEMDAYFDNMKIILPLLRHFGVEN